MDDAKRPNTERSPALSAETMGQPLSRERFADLYRLAEEGLPYFARLNGLGDVEICLLFESVDAFVEASRDEATLEFRTYQDKLIAVVWTIADPRQPLGFPLRLAVREERDRKLALRMAEQPAIPIHHLAWEEGRIVHVYTEEARLTEKERQYVMDSVIRLCERSEAGTPAEETEVGGPAESISAGAIPDSVLKEEGIAYVLHYGRLEERAGPEQAQVLLMEAVQRALNAVRRHPREEVCQSSFTVWVARREDVLWLCVTPSLSPLFEVVDESDERTHPFTRFLLALPEFVEIREARPLALGAYPIIRFERGAAWHVELDEAVRLRLAALCEQAGHPGPNPYADWR